MSGEDAIKAAITDTLRDGVLRLGPITPAEVRERPRLPAAVDVQRDRLVVRVPQHVGACYKPLAGTVVLLVDGNAVELTLREASDLRDMLTAALAIAGGFHPLQVETAPQSFAENANKSGGAQ